MPMDAVGAATSNAWGYDVYQSSQTENKNGIMGKDDYLKLFLAALKYQDPMSPMATNDMMSQMSQLTLVESVTNLSKVVEEMKELATGTPIDNAVGYLGKEVTGQTENGTTVEGVVEEVRKNGQYLEFLVNGEYILKDSINRIAILSAYEEAL